jgi:hypothetical protein
MVTNTPLATPAKSTPARKSRTVKAVAKASPAKVAAKSDKKHKKEKKSGDKVRVVRDSFTMPQNDYALITSLKEKALSDGVHLKKSELLRAGLRSLSKLTTTQLKNAVADLEKIKTGRPKKV